MSDKKYINPFKNSGWKNPGKTFEESQKRVKEKHDKLFFSNEIDFVEFDLEKIKEAMKQKGTLMPELNTLEELNEWLNRDEENE